MTKSFLHNFNKINSNAQEKCIYYDCKDIFKKNVLNLLKITRKLMQLTTFKKVSKQTF